MESPDILFQRISNILLGNRSGIERMMTKDILFAYKIELDGFVVKGIPKSCAIPEEERVDRFHAVIH